MTILYAAIMRDGKFARVIETSSHTGNRIEIEHSDLNDCTILSILGWENICKKKPDGVNNIITYVEAYEHRIVTLYKGGSKQNEIDILSSEGLIQSQD